MIKNFDKYKTIESNTLGEIYDELGGLSDVDVRELLNHLRMKYFNKRVKILKYNFIVRRIKLIINATSGRNDLSIGFCDSIEKNAMEIFPVINEKIYLLENRIISKEDPYGEENWDD